MNTPVEQMDSGPLSIDANFDQSEADLRDKFRNLLRYTTDKIYFKDRNSTFTLCSDSLEKHLAQPGQESIVGKSDFDFYDFECATKFFDDEQEIMRTGQPIIGQVDTETRNGEITWMFSSKIPLRDADGNIIGTFGISRDITEQKQTELELSEANRQLVDASRRAGKAEIATQVIHNVGNVLTSIKVAVSESDKICSQQPFDKLERVADLIQTHADDECFFQEGQRGSHIPDYLRSLATSLEDDKAKLKKELADCKRHLEHMSMIVAQQQKHATAVQVIQRVDISQLVSDAIQMSSSSLKNHYIGVVRNFKDGMFVETDKHQVLQIIVNLIRNAKHACLDAGSGPRMITIAVEDSGDEQFTISVADNGVGVAEENLAKLFTYGFTTRKRGNGFGLHSCANTAKELQGSLSVHSDGVGKGSTFVLTLPGKLNERPSRS